MQVMFYITPLWPELRRIKYIFDDGEYFVLIVGKFVKSKYPVYEFAEKGHWGP